MLKDLRDHITNPISSDVNVDEIIIVLLFLNMIKYILVNLSIQKIL